LGRLYSHTVPSPTRFSFARNKNILDNKAKVISEINQLFHLPISQEVFGQLFLLAQDLEALEGGRACLAGLRLLQKRLRLWLLWWSGFSGGVESF
jgi:hypothetical protein